MALSFIFASALGFSPALAQYGYRVGSGQSAIEPDQTFFSLTLAGYGAPREGRFTLNWMPQRVLGDVTDAAIFSGKLFYLSNSALRVLPLAGDPAVPTEILPATNLRLLAAGDSCLYGINARSELLKINFRRRKVKLQRLGKIDLKAIALARTDDGFVLIDEAGISWRAEEAGGTFSWRSFGAQRHLTDVLFEDGSLYGLTAQNEILKLQKDGAWVRIALRNELTYNEDIRQILSGQEGFYGITRQGQLVKAGHNSTGQLSAGALSVRSENDRIVIVGVDVCGFDASFVSEVKDTIFRRFGVPPSAVLVNASHTHFAPVTQSWATWGPHCQKPDSSYLNRIVKRGIIAAVSQAITAEQPASLYFGRTTAEIGHNRNLPGDDLPYDSDLDVIKVEYQRQDKSDILFLAGCHPVFSNSGREGITISPNYPGVARQALSSQRGVAQTLFLQGCGGDINPVDENHRVTAQKVVAAVNRVLDSDMTAINGNIDFHLDTVIFDIRSWPAARVMAFRKEHAGKEGDVGAEKNVRWADLMLSYYEEGAMPAAMPVYVQTINIGNWKLVGLSREAATEYSLGIKQLWPEKLVSVAGYCNDVSSYLPTRRHISAGVYEGYDSFFWYGQPGIFPPDVLEIILKKIKSSDR